MLREVRCGWCNILFYICRSCWRGQAYCCDECRIAGRRKRHREAQRRYRQSLKGKKAHREAENRRRHGLSKKNQKKMDDATSTLLSKGCKVASSGAQSIICVLDFAVKVGLSRIGRCHFCGCWGVIVEKFPRRGYGGGITTRKWHRNWDTKEVNLD